MVLRQALPSRYRCRWNRLQSDGRGLPWNPDNHCRPGGRSPRRELVDSLYLDLFMESLVKHLDARLIGFGGKGLVVDTPLVDLIAFCPADPIICHGNLDILAIGRVGNVNIQMFGSIKMNTFSNLLKV